ncbi:MAG: hypothetical protein Q8N60_01120, partial [Candidatus Diapherotrites archaeon]|nr:hypothetical protein [Candidatus Diapherotrites archaeon]
KNNVGASIPILGCVGSNAFATNVFGCPTSIEKDAEITLHPVAVRAPVHMTYTVSYIELSYINYFGVKKTEKIVVSGLMTIVS